MSARSGRFSDPRVLTDVTWPTIRPRDRLLRGGQVLREGEEAVSGLARLSRVRCRIEVDPQEV